MQIQKIDNTNFQAKIVVKTDDMKNFMKYLQSNLNAPEGWYNSKRDLLLMNWIFKAFDKHPSKEEISPDIQYIKGAMCNARGRLTSSKAALVDSEPARSGGIAPILNIFRRILNPENKVSFNKLMGEEYAPNYDSWWKNYISPVWDKINTNFREVTFFKDNHDKEFNKDFNEQINNYWIELWNKTIK